MVDAEWARNIATPRWKNKYPFPREPGRPRQVLLSSRPIDGNGEDLQAAEAAQKFRKRAAGVTWMPRPKDLESMRIMKRA